MTCQTCRCVRAARPGAWSRRRQRVDRAICPRAASCSRPEKGLPPLFARPYARRMPTRVYIEIGKRRVFASAADWPGWARSGKDEKSALEALPQQRRGMRRYRRQRASRLRRAVPSRWSSGYQAIPPRNSELHHRSPTPSGNVSQEKRLAGCRRWLRHAGPCWIVLSKRLRRPCGKGREAGDATATR